MQVRPLTGLVIDQEEGDPGSVDLAFERQRAAGTAMLAARMTWYIPLP